MGEFKSMMVKKMQKNLPQARDDSGEVTESGTVNLDVLDNDRGGKSKSIFLPDQSNPASATNEGEWVVLASDALIKFDGDQVVYDTNGVYKSLAEDETAFETFTYTIQMGKGAISTAEVTIKITGQNDIAQMTGDSGEVTEDGTQIASGTVIVADADTDQSGTQVQNDVAGTYGTFSINDAGGWTYELNNDNTDVQDLDTGEMLSDSFTVFSTDGFASTTVDITINGTDDNTNTAPVAESDRIIASVSTNAVIPVEWLLQNDSDADGGMLTVTAIDDSGLPAGWTVTPIFAAGNLVSFTVNTPSDAMAEPLVLNYTTSNGTDTSMSTVTIALAGPSSAENDAMDISAEDYNFSFIDGKAGVDTVTGGSEAVAPVSTGTIGSDFLIGGDGSDALTGGQGDDVLRGGNIDGFDTDFATNSLNGDNAGAVTLAVGEQFVGGNDALTGGSGAAGVHVNNTLIGDAQAVFSSAASTFTGGDDVLTGGSGVNFMDFGYFVLFDVNNTLVGDVGSIGDSNGTFIGGNDTLISGMLAADIMTGDSSSGVAGTFTGGSDTFVFGSDNGTDIITDFEQGTDIINLSDTGLDFVALDSDGSGTLDALDDNISISGANTVIDLGGAAGGSTGPSTVTVNGVTGMDATDFDFSMLIA